MGPLDTPPVAEPRDDSNHQMPERNSSARRPYEKPRVIDHGRLADIALGGSPGVGDSGGAATQLPP